MRTLRVVSLLGMVLSPIAATHLDAQQVQVSGTNRTIAVTATAEAKSKADTATIHIGYQIYGPTSDAVTDDAGKTSKEIFEALLKTGVTKDAIESESQSTNPVQEYQQNGSSPAERSQRQFMAEQHWTVRTTADGAALVLAAATAAGANESGAIDWSVADDTALSAEAAAKALRHAREIAAQMAQGLGVRLGELVYASNEAQAGPIRPMMMVRGGPPQPLALTKQLSVAPAMVTRSTTVSAIFAIQ